VELSLTPIILKFLYYNTVKRQRRTRAASCGVFILK